MFDRSIYSKKVCPKLTKEQVKSFFIELEEKELDLYKYIIENNQNKILLIDKLKEITYEEYTKPGKEFEAYFHEMQSNIDIFNKMMSYFRTSEAPRHWVRWVFKSNFHNNEMKIKFNHIKDMKSNFVEINSGLVGKILKDTVLIPLCNDGKLDLQQEGCIGLMKAIDKFDHTMDRKFSVYAAWWIKNEINTFLLNKDKNIKLPKTATDSYKTMWKSYYEHMAKKGYAPSTEKLMELTKLDREVIESLLVGVVIKSLDKIVKDSHGDDTNTNGYATLSDTNIVDPANDIYAKSLNAAIQKAIKTLPQRNQYIVTKRFNDEDVTLAELGREIGISRERVRQIEAESFRMMREHLVLFKESA